MYFQLLRGKRGIKIYVLIFLVTFCVVLPIYHRETPFSVYFNVDRSALTQQGLEINKFRYKKALSKLREYSKDNHIISHNKGSSDLDIIAAIVTVKRVYGREKLGYLTQVAVGIEELPKAPSGVRIGAVVCDVHAGPGTHDEVDDLTPYFDVIRRFPLPSPYHAVKDIFDKEREDYAFCLQSSLHYNAKYLLILEDDAVPVHDAKVVLDKVLKSLTPNDHFILKLFYPPRWQGFSLEARKIAELIAIGFFCCVVVFVCELVLWRFRLTRTRVRNCSFHVKQRIAVYAAVFAFVILVVLAIGRQQSLLALRRASPHGYWLVPAPECCSPAILYPRDTAQKLVYYLNHTACSPQYPLDAALDNFRQRYSIPAYLIEPNLVDHIGMVSTLKGITRYPEEFLK